MLIGTHSLASIASVFVDALHKSYAMDCAPLLEEAGLDLAKMHVPGARYPDANFDRLWEIVLRETGDECVGLVVGKAVRVTTFHALGFAWMASDTLHDAFRRLVRYDRIVTTGTHLEFDEAGSLYSLELRTSEPDYPLLPVSTEAYFTSILTLCRHASDNHIVPAQVRLTRAPTDRAGDFAIAFDAPVQFGADVDQLLFDRSIIDAPLPGRNIELALANDRVAESYLQSLNPELLATRVRELLIQMLPSGHVSQDRVAKRLNRSTSTLHRHLVSEGISFKWLRDEVRKELALHYLRDQQLSLSEIAFLTGFSEQSNFTRAFRRWTGIPPTAYRQTLAPQGQAKYTDGRGD